MKILIMKFRVNDLDPSIGKQIEFSNKIVQDFFEFKKDKEYVDFIYNDYAFKPFYNKKVIHVYLSLSPARGDYKVYQNEDNSLFLKNFFIQNLGLSPEKNKNDYFTLTKLSSTQYALSYIPCESDLGRLIIGNQIKSGDVVEAIEDNEKPQKRTRINHLRKKLEEYAIANNLLVSVDSYGDRVIFQNGCVIDVSKNTLFTCIHNDRFDLFKTSINEACGEKKYWHICTATEVFPQEPYAASKISEILDGSDDKCLYTEIFDESKFETILGELIDILSKQRIISKYTPFTPTQIIYYGVPGCGKSHEIKKKLKNVPDYNKIRTVFHPEYSNADFVGQILPEVNIDTNGRSIVEYKFKPGPFTEIVRRAYLNPDESFYLVIEEINRGNAAAIFGEMFQLLDRLDADENADEVSSEHIYGKGWSSYGVDNQDVNAYIRNQVIISQEKPEHCSNVTGSAGDLNPRLYKSMDIESENVTVTWREKNENGFTPKSKHIHFTANTAIRLPPNLSIYATMNTSDQNVFTLDNAFQRRWEMKQVPNKLRNSLPKNATEEQKKELEAEIEQYNEYIGGTKEEGGTGVKWGVFRDEINKIIMRSAEDNGLSSMEDKRLGGWFIVPKKPDEKEDSKAVITKQAFAEKVLKYLWDDAFKFDRNSHFNFNKDEEPTLEKLIENFGNKEFEVFIDSKIRELQKNTPPDNSVQNAATTEQ